MSTTNTASAATSNEIDTKEINKFALYNKFVAAGLTLVATFLILTATIIAFNYGEFTTSFWLGFLALFAVGLTAGLLWITHHMQRRHVGYVITFIYIIVLVVVLLSFTPNYENIAIGKLFLGMLDAAILVGLFFLNLLHGKIRDTLWNKYVADSE